MDCKSFLDILDTGREGVISATERSGFDLHAESCPSCRNALRTAQALRKAYAGRLPDGRKVAAFQQNLLTRIDQIAADAAPTSSGKPVAGLIGAGVGTALLGSLLYFFLTAGTPVRTPAGTPPQAKPAVVSPASSAAPVPASSPVAPLLAHITGDPLLVWQENGKMSSTASTTLSIAEGAPLKIGCVQGCRIAFAAGESVEIRGEAQFTPEPHGMELFGGQATYTFHAVQGSFKVRMPQVVLAIRGTVLGIRIMPGEDLVWVEEGVISWEHLRSKASGVLQRGAGMRFRREKAEAWKLLPDVIPSGAPATMSSSFLQPVASPTLSDTNASPSTDGVVASSAIGEPVFIKGTDDGF